VTGKGVLISGIWVVALAAIVLAFMVRDSSRSVGRQADMAATRFAAAAAYDIARNVELLDPMLRVAAGNQAATSLERMPRDRYVSLIELINEKGDVIGASPPAYYGENWAGRDYFQEAKKNAADALFIGRPFGTNGENAAVPLSRRISDAEGNFGGVAVLGLRLTYFQDLLRALDPGPDAIAWVVQPDGTALAKVPYERSEPGRSIASSTPIQTFLRTGQTAITAIDPLDHIERRFAFRRVGTLPLVVGVGVSTHELYADGLPSLWLVVAGFAIATMLLLRLTLQSQRDHRRLAAAEHGNAEKTQFLTTLSHALRTPLHGVQGYAEQLSHDGLPPEPARRVAQIIRSCRHMRDVVNMVLDFARMEALGPALHMRQLDVRAVIDECLGVVRPDATARSLELRVTANDDAPGHFVTDEHQLKQVLLNLLSNAVKYTLQGWVEVRVMGDQETLRLEIADSGIGIPECQRHRLFNEYERFGAEQTSVGGTGLGLSIAHRLVRRMGGHMGHRSQLTGGSVFWLELPAGAETAAEPAIDRRGALEARSLHVLLADDADINREVTASFLRQAGHSVSEAYGGLEAVRLAATHDFDLVLMDMRMPDLDGLEATRRIRLIGGRRGQVPIVAVTANALDQHAEECRNAGMSEHLTKPFTRQELLSVVARAAARPTMPIACAAAPCHAAWHELAASLGEEEVERLLDCLALRIQALLRRLDDPFPADSVDELIELAHELVGSGGTLGFTQLASAAARFEAAGGVGSDALRREAEAALSELRQRQSMVAIIEV
jgi:signal transduction histidine kinase/CheY-like chemotaxis protein/HPt (histidine-containing phosphotransfer) domain-containing protein